MSWSGVIRYHGIPPSRGANQVRRLQEFLRALTFVVRTGVRCESHQLDRRNCATAVTHLCHGRAKACWLCRYACVSFAVFLS
jgi:hypothetical protein